MSESFQISLNEQFQSKGHDEEIQIIDCKDHEIGSSFFSQVETNFIEHFLTLFQSVSQEINFGETIMSRYIDFCETKQEFPVEHFQAASRQFRLVH